MLLQRVHHKLQTLIKLAFWREEVGVFHGLRRKEDPHPGINSNGLSFSYMLSGKRWTSHRMYCSNDNSIMQQQQVHCCLLGITATQRFGYACSMYREDWENVFRWKAKDSKEQDVNSYLQILLLFLILYPIFLIFFGRQPESKRLP